MRDGQQPNLPFDAFFPLPPCLPPPDHPTPLPACLPAVISIHLFITAYHGGRHVFRLCPNATATKACVEANPLQR